MTTRLFCAGSLLILSGLVSPVAGDDFRVETEIFVGREKEPAVENVTIFAGGRVYDFLIPAVEEGEKAEIREITVFDPERGVVDLLDVKRKLRTTVTTDQMLRFTSSIILSGPNLTAPR